MLFLCNCASYNSRVAPYYKKISEGNFQEAEQNLSKIALLKKPRNKLLYLLEMGRVSHLNGDYEASNNYFNEADRLLEIGLSNVQDAVVGVVLNPMAQNYKGEDFEKFMVHYYKALNYLYLQKTEDAIVEARRITLQTQEQSDKFNNRENRYTKDAFSLMLQGMIYEHDRDFNNAFIAYRNAANVYLGSSDSTSYGIKIPFGLKYDVMRMAYLNGFDSELQHFEQLFKIPYEHYIPGEGGELILFWENGLAPIKQQEEILFSMIKGSDGDWFFTNSTGTIYIPVDRDVYKGGSSLNDVHTIRATLPRYISSAPYYSEARVEVDNETLYFEKAEDINVLAVETLKQRYTKEIGKMLTRLAVKKTAEYVLKESAKGTGKDGKDNVLLESLGFGVQLYSLLSEKADTRNWQSLPNEIYYTRIPLKKGTNNIVLHLIDQEGNEQADTITINGNGRLQFVSYPTLR
ncbi:COG3014 family protein [Olivibacter sp. SDN3]|uniref:COG3014 family protein n=1 Tax=Olivibacter sp. SDN3 TaxID=2764720 RepID=UPI0021022D87|nr:hypothetical protein [Olivibacter sp. SDN3]